MYPAVVRSVSSNHIRILVLILVALAFLLFLPAVAGAQPFGAWGVWDATAGKYVDILSYPGTPSPAIIDAAAFATCL